MIKRRFYKEQHEDNDDDSDSASSSSSDSEIEPEQTENTEPEDVETESESEEQLKKEERQGVSGAKPGRLQVPSPSSSSGCASEDGSLVQVPAYPSGIDSSDDDQIESRKRGKKMSKMIRASNSDDAEDGLKYVLLSKSTFKCRICPKIVCLNEETLKLHLQSKRHARSEKLLNNGKLKCMLNSDGEEENFEEEGETHAERHARILSLTTSQKEEAKKKVTGGRQRQRMRLKNKKRNDSSAAKESCGKEDIAMKKKSLKDAKQSSGKEGIATTTKKKIQKYGKKSSGMEEINTATKKKSQKDGKKSSGREEIDTATKKKRRVDAKESSGKREIGTNKRSWEGAK